MNILSARSSGKANDPAVEEARELELQSSSSSSQENEIRRSVQEDAFITKLTDKNEMLKMQYRHLHANFTQKTEQL
jgi:hypothetical protein